MNRLCLMACLSLAMVVSAKEWTGFRGPNGSGVSQERGLPRQWNATQNVVWKCALPGPGSSSPILWGDHVYVTCYSGYGLDPEAPGDIARLARHLVCVHRDSGRILWKQTTPAIKDESPFTGLAIQLHGYASHTPAADASGVYVFFGSSGTACYSHEGKLRWRTPCGSKVHEWGSAASVVLHDDMVIVTAALEGDALLALDKKNGREVWRVEGLAGSYTTPAVVEVSGNRELIICYDEGHISGLDPNTGEKLWSCRAFQDWVTGLPVSHQGVIYAVGGWTGHAAAVRAGGRGEVTGTHKLWELNKGTYVPSLVYHRGHLYWAREDGGIVYCANAKTGKLVYQERLTPNPGRIYASPIIADDKLYYISRENGAYVLPASPEFKVLSHNTIDTDKSVFNGSPAVSRGRLLLRSDKYLYCIGTK